jgi:tetratricopeptide (TPR) repeat protein
MSISKSILPLFICLSLATISWGQGGFSEQISRDRDRASSLNALEKSAKKSLDEGDYATAMHRYKKVMELDSLQERALRGYGEAAVKNAALEQAEWAYTRMVNNKLNAGPGKAPTLLLADVEYRLGKYAEAKEMYQRFLADDKNVINGELMETIQTNMDNCDWALGMLPSTLLKTPLMLLDTPMINSEYSEYSPYLKGDTLYFSSYRFPFEKDRHNPERKLIKILSATQHEGMFQVTPLDINEEALHTAHLTFNEKNDREYYCECKFVGNVEIRCDLFRRTLMPGNVWGPAQKLPDYINLPEFTTTEPSIGRAPESNEEVLYFVSDRPEGQGKRDIWYSKILGDSLTPPVNLKEINTKEDDITPFYHSGSGTLYFSTDGRQTMGGFDIYQSKGAAGKTWSTPEHMRTPLNSGANDVFFSMSRNGLSVFMASNRRGSQNTSEEACCYDLFKADLQTPKMIAIAFNKETNDTLRYTTMRLIELSPDGVVLYDKKISVDGPYYAFDLQPGRKYMIIGEKDHFSPDTVRFNTPNVTWNDVLVKKLYLTPAHVNLIVTVLDKDTKKPITGVTSLFYDYGATIPVPNKVSVPAQTKVNQSGNQFEYPLEFDKHYKVAASKIGYTTDSTLVSTLGLKGNTTIRDTLYINRGVNLKAFTTDFLTKDTLYGVTYRLIDLTANQQKDRYVSPLGKNYTQVLSLEKRYRIIAEKADYTSDSVDITTLNLPKVEFQTIIRELRLRPLTIDKYLPILLYFDNDEPDKRTLARATKREYRVTYVDYIRQKEEFIAKFTEGLSGADLKQSTDSIDYFFERQVRGGWDRLMAFSEVLYEMMGRGDTIEITLKGFASPRAGTAYNLNLTDRRVSSVYNHFDQFDGGIYKKFVDSKQLIFIREPNGESKSPKNISSDIKDKRKSIYDVRASRERRLEIIGVRTNGRQIIAPK